MATTKKIGPRRKQAGKLLPGQDFYLCTGVLLDGVDDFPSEAEKKRMWEAHRKELIKSFCREYPGRMPHGWWRYDAPAEAAHDDTTRGFYAFRRNNESEHDCILRLGFLEEVKQFDYKMPENPPENVTLLDHHKM